MCKGLFIYYLLLIEFNMVVNFNIVKIVKLLKLLFVLF